MSEETRYQITLTATQAAMVRDACELLFRCRIGQIGEACRYVLDANGRASVPYEVKQDAEDMVKAAVGLPMNASWGVGKFDVADQACDLYQVIRHRLAWDRAYSDGMIKPGELRRWPEMLAVHYDPPLHLSTQPLATIKVADDV